MLTVTNIAGELVDITQFGGEVPGSSVRLYGRTVRLTNGTITLEVPDWVSSTGSEVPQVGDRFEFTLARVGDAVHEATK